MKTNFYYLFSSLYKFKIKRKPYLLHFVWAQCTWNDKWLRVFVQLVNGTEKIENISNTHRKNSKIVKQLKFVDFFDVSKCNFCVPIGPVGSVLGIKQFFFTKNCFFVNFRNFSCFCVIFVAFQYRMFLFIEWAHKTTKTEKNWN